MTAGEPLTFKTASEPWEFGLVHKLNYRTFVEEIPQHEPNRDGALVDKFHSENAYLICLRGRDLLGMVAVRDKRPFSLDRKLGNLDTYLPEGRTVCEVRLLSVEEGHRRGRVFVGLLKLLNEYCREQGYDLAVISGTVRQLRLYKHLGFVPFGPMVGTAEALYQPMYLTLEDFNRSLKIIARLLTDPAAGQTWVNLLPGPVGVSQDVRKVFREDPVSHRSKAFVRDFRRTKNLLCELVGAEHVEILVGSGSLANDAIAGQLSLLGKPGVILTNGEFGERIVDHATRFGLDFEKVEAEWGDPLDRETISAALDRNADNAWLWAVHCETSTSILNDLEAMKALCAERDVKLCMDCISSIGTVPVDLRGVYLASGVSGKGLGAFPGLSMVFYNHTIAPEPKRLPRYLDLGFYAAQDGIPFTHSSNLLYALRAAVKQLSSGKSYDELAELSNWLRAELADMGFDLVGTDGHASPAVITIVLPNELSSEDVGLGLEEAGYLLSYRSAYLLKRNWIQICLMGEYSRDMVGPLLNVIKSCCR